MTRDWTVTCKDCGNSFPYSDRSAREAGLRGESRPERCLGCRTKHSRATARMGAAYVDLDPGDRPVGPGALKAGRLGRLDGGSRPHTPDDRPEVGIPEGTFGITDDHVRQLLAGLDDHQVVVVEAPTGSGKSTFLPWRLLHPPAPYPEDHVTRHGTIVVTQPRIEATQGIPRYIAKELHGARVGAGVDIGYRHSQAKDQADIRNRLVYATDGTLLNMIRRGELYACSTVVIDEAHERSLNIDLILALLRRELVALPQLRLLIVSATIDAETFAGLFEPEIPVLRMEMPGTESKPVHERWRAAPPIPEAQWPARMPGEVARATYEVLRWIAGGERPADIPEDVPAYDGDILAFLPGKRAIHAAIEELGDLLDDDPDLAGNVELLPLYAELPQRDRTRALSPRTGRKGRRRVVMATNIAETSLTVEGIRHVVDSGLINTTEWDVATLTTVVRPRPHSRAGLRQRRGRAGRVAPGVWHCLFTRAQFDQLPADTPPEITRAPLEGVVLAASAAGVGDPASLRWVPPGPPTDELRRAQATLRGMSAIDAHGDPTALGAELSRSREPFTAASLLVCADEAGVAVEAATVLAAMADRRWVQLLRWGAWPAVTRVHADRLHTTLLSECNDDLDVVLLLMQQWEMRDNHERRRWADGHLLSVDAMEAIARKRAELLQSLQSRTKTEQVRRVDLSLAGRLRRVIAWAGPNGIYRRSEDGWVPELVPRADPEVVSRLHQGARPVLDADSLLARRPHPPELLVALVRDRRRSWVSPLVAPEDLVTLSFCVALGPHHLAGDVPLLAHLAGHQAGAAPSIPPVLPGERLVVEELGRRSDGVQVRVLAEENPVPVPAVDVADDEAEAPERGDLDQRSVGAVDLDGLVVDNHDAADYLGAELDEVTNQLSGGQPEPDASMPEPLGRREAFAGLEVVTRSFDRSHPIVVVEDVTAGVVRAAADPVAAIRRFADAYQPGDVCTVEVREVRMLHRDRRRVLITRELSTGVELALTGWDIGFGVRDTQLDAGLIGTTAELAVGAVDPDDGFVELTALPRIVSALRRLTEDQATSLDGVVIDARGESVYVSLQPDGSRLLGSDPPITVEVRADDLPPRPAEMSLGQPVRVRARRKVRREVAVEIDLPTLRLPTGPFEKRPGALAIGDLPTARDVLRLLAASHNLPLDEAAALRRALGRLVIRALRPRVDIIDVTGLAALRDADRTHGVVVAATPQRVVLEVEGGTRSVIAREFLAWPGQEPPPIHIGETIEAHVTDVDPAAGRLLLSLRDPADDPIATLQVGAMLRGQVIAADAHGLVVRLYEQPVDAFVPARESAVRGQDLEARFPVGADVGVRLLETDLSRRRVIASRWLWEDHRRLPAGVLDVVRGPTGPDPNRLRPALGRSVDLRINGDELQLRWTDDPTDIQAHEVLARLNALVGGVRGEISIPHTRAVTRDVREAICRETGCLMRVEKRQLERSRWFVVAVAPDSGALHRLVAMIQAAHPNLVRWSSFHTTAGPIAAAVRAFRAAERERQGHGLPHSSVWFERPFNYLELGENDSYQAVHGRLAAHGIAVDGAEWASDHRVMLTSGPVPVA